MWYTLSLRIEVFHRLHLLSLWGTQVCLLYTADSNTRYFEMDWRHRRCCYYCRRCDWARSMRALWISQRSRGFNSICLLCTWTEVPRAAFTHLRCQIHGIDKRKNELNWTKRHNNNSSADCFNSPTLWPAVASISTFQFMCLLVRFVVCCFFLLASRCGRFYYCFCYYEHSSTLFCVLCVRCVCMIILSYYGSWWTHTQLSFGLCTHLAFVVVCAIRWRSSPHRRHL